MLYLTIESTQEIMNEMKAAHQDPRKRAAIVEEYGDLLDKLPNLDEIFSPDFVSVLSKWRDAQDEIILYADQKPEAIIHTLVPAPVAEQPVQDNAPKLIYA